MNDSMVGLGVMHWSCSVVDDWSGMMSLSVVDDRGVMMHYLRENLSMVNWGGVMSLGVVNWSGMMDNWSLVMSNNGGFVMDGSSMMSLSMVNRCSVMSWLLEENFSVMNNMMRCLAVHMSLLKRGWLSSMVYCWGLFQGRHDSVVSLSVMWLDNVMILLGMSSGFGNLGVMASWSLKWLWLILMWSLVMWGLVVDGGGVINWGGVMDNWSLVMLFFVMRSRFVMLRVRHWLIMMDKRSSFMNNWRVMMSLLGHEFLEKWLGNLNVSHMGILRCLVMGWCLNVLNLGLLDVSNLWLGIVRLLDNILYLWLLDVVWLSNHILWSSINWCCWSVVRVASNVLWAANIVAVVRRVRIFGRALSRSKSGNNKGKATHLDCLSILIVQIQKLL